MYFVGDNQLYSGNPATAGFSTEIGAPNPSGNYNALAYNPTDNYLYAIGNSGSIENQLLRIEDDGTVLPLGVTTGLPLAGNVTSGSFDEDGNYWVASGAQVRQIDITSNAIVDSLSPGIPGLQNPDFVVYDGKIIRFKTTTRFGGPAQISTIDPATETYTATTGSTIPSTFVGAVAMWVTADGHLFAGDSDGQVWEILDWQTNTPSALLRASFPGPVGDGDGTMCALATSPFGISAQDDDYSSTPVLASEGGVVGNIWSNDSVDSVVATDSNVETSITDDGGLTGVAIGADGAVTVPAGAAPGTYDIDYTICSVAVPDECASATITVVLTSSNGNNDDDGPPAPPTAPVSVETGI